MDGWDVMMASVVSVASFLPSSPLSPNKLVTDDAMPAPMTLLIVSNVPPDLSFNITSRASLCAGSRESESFSKFWIAGKRNSRTLVVGISATRRECLRWSHIRAHTYI